MPLGTAATVGGEKRWVAGPPHPLNFIHPRREVGGIFSKIGCATRIIRVAHHFARFFHPRREMSRGRPWGVDAGIHPPARRVKEQWNLLNNAATFIAPSELRLDILHL
jgi:hypothetical protein